MHHNVPPCKRWTDVGYKDKIMIDQIIQIVKWGIRNDVTDKIIKDQILSFLSENTGGVSTSLDKSGVSHGVSDRNASQSSSDEASKEVVGGALALRTQDENLCPICSQDSIVIHNGDMVCYNPNCSNE